VSDPFIRSQSKRQNLGSTRIPGSNTAGAAGGARSDAQVAEAYLRSSGPGGTREKLNNFLSKLETTWKLFNRSSLDSPEGELPEDGRMALLEDGETPTPETLKKMRARFKQQAQKPQKNSPSLFKTKTSEQRKADQKKSSSAPDKGPKDSPLSDRNTPQSPTQRPKPPAPQAKQSQAKEPPKPQQQPTPKQADPKPAPQQQKAPVPLPQPKASSAPKPESPKPKEPPPQRSEDSHMKRPEPRTPTRAPAKGSVLGRKPGTSTTTPKKPASKPSPQQDPSKPQLSHSGIERRPSSKLLGQRRPQLMGRPGGPTRGPAGSPTSKSFLGTSSHAGSQLRSSDASGQPGKATSAAPTRQAVYSQSVAQVHPNLKKRQVSSQMPVHNSFLDECHDGGSDSGPIRLNWTAGQKKARSPAQRMFAHRKRLQLQRRGSGGQSMGNPISMQSGQTGLAAARTDVSTRIAGAAIGSLLDDLYEEEDVENLDEETAVTSLGLILRLGGEFTYNHSTRVLDLAMELADEVGIRDKETRKEIKFGTVLRDIGEFDLLLQGGSDADKRMQEFSGFLAGQDMLRAGLLHDIGKVQIPPEILYKPGKLTEEEYELMKMHPIYGEEIVSRIASLRYLCPTIRGHHERWDGKGYPDGLAGEKIPLAARIISVADVFDALAAERPYKRGMEVRKVKDILSEGRGTHFDPFLVDAFLDVILRRYPDA
jgi:HD-GYP domain-containing protein (c-di-GMP phosphodiesterase class II)